MVDERLALLSPGVNPDLAILIRFGFGRVQLGTGRSQNAYQKGRFQKNTKNANDKRSNLARSG